jgi:hypothetical protein
MRVKKHFVEYFRKAVQEMNYDSPIYKMLKRELTAKGYWRNRPRGKPGADNLRGKR